VLELLDVRVDFAGTAALDGITLTFPAGTTTVVLGPSGCGKSTLLRVAMGLQRPAAGEVRIAGRRPAAPEWRRVRHGIGYVTQGGGLFPHLDVFENVTLAARHLGVARAELERRFAALLEIVRLVPDVRRRRPDELSGGQRQRVALMRALMLDPPLLLLDEPLGALDPLVRRDLQLDLRELFRRRDRTVVMVTHDIAEAVLLGERAVLMRSGRVVQDDAPAALLDAPVEPFVADFVAAQRGAREWLAVLPP
jgi:osmoprotectant transport system ATP-binding protein